MSLLLHELFDTDVGINREENAETTRLDTPSDIRTMCPEDSLGSTSYSGQESPGQDSEGTLCGLTLPHTAKSVPVEDPGPPA